MKRLTTQLTALLLLLAGSSLSASAKVVVTDTLELLGNSDVKMSTLNSRATLDTANYKLVLDTTTAMNDAIELSYSFRVDTTSYTRLVIELDSASNDDIELYITSTKGWNWVGDNSQAILGEGGTKFVFDLSNLRNCADSVNYVAVLTGWVSNQVIDLKSVRFEKDTCIAEDYEEIDYSTGYAYKSGAKLTNDGDYMNLTLADGGAWAYDISDIGTSAYKYLVVVPRYPWTNKCNYLGYDEIEYCISDSVDYTYSITKTETKWGENYNLAWGEYQRHRAAVFNIEDGIRYSYSDGTSEYIKEDSVLEDSVRTWTKLYLQKGYVSKGGGDEFELSAIYFTNTLPTYDNECHYGGTTANRWDLCRTYSDSLTYGTVCLPYPSAACGAYVYDVVGYSTDNSGNPSELYLEEVTGVLKGGKAYVICSNTNNYNGGQQGYVTFTKAGSDVTDYDNSKDGLKGNTENSDKTIDSNYYILFADSTMEENGTDSTAVYKWGKGSNNTVGQYKAYLDLSVFEKSTDTETAKANGWISMSLAYDGDDGTTGIKEIVSEEEDASDDDAIYNLSGVRVTNPQKGIYIKNGKKYIIK